MSYKLLKISSIYQSFLSDFYSHEENYVNLTYNEQLNKLLNSGFGLSNFYISNLEKIDIEAEIIIKNATFLQNQWAKEQNFTGNTNQILLQQIKKSKPTVIWLEDIFYFDIPFIDNIRQQNPQIKLIFGQVCSPYDDGNIELMKKLDFILSCIPLFQNNLSEIGIKSFLVYLGFEKSVLEKIKNRENIPNYKFLFTGSLLLGKGFHNDRIFLINSLLKAGIDINLMGNIAFDPNFINLYINRPIYHIGSLLEKIMGNTIKKIPYLRYYENFRNITMKPYHKNLIKRLKPAVYGFEMYKYLANANIVLNTHGDIACNCAGNMRLFETTGVATCLLTDMKTNLKDLYEPDYEVVTYTSTTECIEKVNWLLNNPEETIKIAKAGQLRTLKNHTIELRTTQIHEIIVNQLKK